MASSVAANTVALNHPGSSLVIPLTMTAQVAAAVFNTEHSSRSIGPTFEVAMSDPHEHIVISYERFSEWRERRRLPPE